MRFAGPVRKELGIRTVFNIIWPLGKSSFFASLQLLGVYKKELVEPLAKVLANLGVKRGIVVYGNDGIDEVTVSSTNTIAEINDGEITEFIHLTHRLLGLPHAKKVILWAVMQKSMQV